MLKKAFGWIVNRWVVSLLGLVIICLMIWYFGPAVAFSGHVPLADAMIRLITIIAVVFLWGIANIIMALRARSANDKIIADLSTPEPAIEDPSAAASLEETERLQERFRDALNTLKTARLGGRKGRRHLYQLPWYIIIGPSGAGKTTALFNSGLKFPLFDRFGKDAIQGVGGTRNCDWFFTDEAVLIDTAGRYSTHDSDETVDRRAWEGFLGLLHKHRPRRPVDGILVAISITDLFGKEPDARVAHARAIKRRIHEVYDMLQVRAPVYLLFTKCDLIAGFTEYFADLGRQDREQVWGMTFTLPESEKPVALLDAFPREFDALIDRLAARQIPRVQEEGDINRRGLLLSFPQQMILLKPALTEFLNVAFGPSRYEQPSFVRGVYFSSATQEGSPVDRVIGAVASVFGLERQAIPAFSGRNVTYFLTRLLKDVIFPEADLVSSTGFVDRNRRWLLWSAYGGLAAVTTGLLGLLLAGYVSNRAYVANVDSNVDEFRETRGKTQSPITKLEEVVPVLNALDVLADPGSAPVLTRVALDQSEKLADASEGAYRRGLRNQFQPLLMARLEDQVSGALGQPDLLYQALRIYLMMAQPERRNPQMVRYWITEDWKNQYPGGHFAQVRSDAAHHLDNLLEDVGGPPPNADVPLISRARERLQSLPMAEGLYKQIKSEQLARDDNPWTLSANVPPDHLRFFQRRGESSKFDGVPRFFTTDGYRDAFIRRREELVGDAVAATWVLGPEYARTQSDQNRANLERRIEELYVNDYIALWDLFINQIELVPYHNIDQQADVVGALAQRDSPIKSVLGAVASQTALSAAMNVAAESPNETPTEVERFRERVERLVGGADPRIESVEKVDPTRRVDAHFEPIHAILRQQGEAPPRIDAVLDTLRDLHDFLLRSAQSGAGGRDALNRFSSTIAGGQDVMNRLEATARAQPQPLQGWLQSLIKVSSAITIDKARQQVRGRVNEVWASSVVPACLEALDGRYPLSVSSPTDANLSDFSRILGPGGAIEQFYMEFVEPFADTSVRPWRWVRNDSQAIGLSSSALKVFENADRIKEAFFPGGSRAPNVAFELQPLTLDKRARQVSLVLGDHPPIVYGHGQRVPTRVSWPPSGDFIARVEISPADQPGRVLVLNKTGPWALFRLLDEATIEGGAGTDRFRVIFSVDGYQAVFQFRADSVVNPFYLPELQSFQCRAKL
jgi:type VI secretion system protein ImpL